VTPEARLAALGLALPEPVVPAGTYAPAVRDGDRVYTSGQVPFANGELLAIGKVGAAVSLEQAEACARQCMLNTLAALQQEIGALTAVTRVVKLTVFVASAPGFHRQPQVANGASELVGELFGEAGRHARSAIGVAALPLDAPVEVEAIFALGGAR
jgi:enamine deaminase RidA (YjgF/YER057c/UK114 family)